MAKILKHAFTEKENVFSIKNKKIEAVIGDEKQEEFYPRLKLKVWDNECNLSVGLKTNPYTGSIASVQEEANVITWREGNTEAKFYPLADTKENEGGGYEFEVILHEPPLSNVIELTLNTPKDLVFHYQPALTEEEIAEGAFRPENVVGSYAVYHATKGNLHKGKGEAEKYKCGKAFHIYRPKIIDAKGNWIWGELNIDVENELMTITIDEKWLDEAIYPITVDPTFGYTEVGKSIMNYGANAFIGVLGKAVYDGKIYWNVAFSRNSYEVNAICCIYTAEEDKKIKDKVAEGENLIIEENIYSWKQAGIDCDVHKGQDYYICFRTGSTSSVWCFDVGQDEGRYSISFYAYDLPPFPSLPDTFANINILPNDYKNFIYSIYASYDSEHAPPTPPPPVPQYHVYKPEPFLNSIELGGYIRIVIDYAYDSLYSYFQYRKKGTSDWINTDKREFLGVYLQYYYFYATINDLVPNTTYEVRMVIEYNDYIEYSGIEEIKTPIPFEVSSYEDLCKIGTGVDDWNLDSNYIQVADIQCPTGVNRHNFIPIGTKENPFKGIFVNTFDEYGKPLYKIKDLYIDVYDENTPDELTKSAGLFGFIEDARIGGVQLENVDIKSNSISGVL